MPNRPAILLGVFTIGAIATLIGGIFLSGSLLGMLGVSGASSAAVTSAILCIGLLVLSRFLLRVEHRTLSTLGLEANAARFRQLGAGFAIAALLFLAVAGVQSAAVGVEWDFQGWLGVRHALIGLAVTAAFVLAEELLFRGVALRYLRAMYGDRPAIVVSALLFGAYHLVQSDNWAMGAVFVFVMPVLGGLLFGWAAVRTNGLALPLGLHLGGNWVQASLAGFSPSDAGTGSTLWRIPISADDVQLLTAPDLLPHLPYLVALALAFAFTLRLLKPPLQAT